MDKVESFYDSHAEYEWNRLERHPMEFAVTMRMLRDYLPPAPARILDVGGGPGRYSVTLAGMGYRMTLLDLSAPCLAFAQDRAAEAGVALEQTIHGNALDLSGLADCSFDAVLLMGPLYHLQKAEDRVRVVAEAQRVLKPGGMLGAAFINRYAVVWEMAADEPERLLPDAARLNAMLETGVFDGSDGGFTVGHGTHPSEVRPLLDQGGFTFKAMIAAEGVTFRNEEKVNQLKGEAWDAWVELSYRLGQDPAIQGAGGHLFAVAQKS